MFAFQIIVDLFCLYAALRVAQKIRSRALSRRWGSFWMAFWLGGAIVISLPWTTSLLAARLGVTRGVDLVIYVSIIALFYLVFRLTLKIERQERQITKLVREIALRDKKTE